MRKALVLATIVALLMLGILSTGCTERDIAQKREESRDGYAPQVAKEWENATGEKLDSNRMSYTDGVLSESHQVMASMILMGNGMNPDLSSYGEGHVAIMEFTDAGGTKRAVVLIDSKVVLPKAAGAQESPTGEIAP